MALTGREMRPCWPQKVAVCNFLEILTYNEKNEKGEDVYAAYHSFIYAGDREY